MHKLSPADELAEIRAEIAKLKAREARLMLMADRPIELPQMRPGWPIRRAMEQPACHA